MKAMRIFALIVLVLVVITTVYGLSLSRTVHVEQRIIVRAPVEAIYPQIANLDNWTHWSPWLGNSQAVSPQTSGPEGRVGYQISWTTENEPDISNRLVISEIQTNRLVRTRLEMGNADTAHTCLTLSESNGERTEITWTFDTDLGMNPMGRFFGPMFSKMIANDFESGLSALKSIVETGQPDTPAR